MYVIVSDKIFRNDLAYLAWQPGCWDDGWTWTFKDCLIDLLPHNAGSHRFVFHCREDAWRAIRNLNLKTGYVIKWEGP